MATTTMTRGKVEQSLFTFMGMAFLLALVTYVSGVPQGANILSNTTEGTPSVSAGVANHSGGTITVLTLNSVQQNNGWKGYVGNVTGRLTLDDASGNTIYDWPLLANNVQGEVYVSRNSTIVWSNVSCAVNTTIINEETALGISSSESDSINSTFNDTTHLEMQVGVNSILNNTCPSIATFINDTRQDANNLSIFQEILLQDEDTALIYATLIRQDESSYKAGSEINETYDFQLIVAEDDASSTPTLYYFYMEIS